MDPKRDDTTFQSALTFAQFAGFAIPGFGVFIAGGVAVLQQVLTSLSPKYTPIPSFELAVKNVLVMHDIATIKDDIQTYYTWYQQNYDAAWTTGLDESTKYKEEFEETLYHALSPSVFTRDMTILMDEDHRLFSGPIFLLGASFHLTLLSIAVLLDSVPKKRIESKWYSILVDRYKTYLTHLNVVRFEIHQKLYQRLDKITEPTVEISHDLQIGAPTIASSRARFSDTETGAQFIFDDLREAQVAYNKYRLEVYQKTSAEYYGVPLESYHIDYAFRHYPDRTLYEVPIDENTHGLPADYEPVALTWLSSYNRQKASLPAPKAEKG